MTVYRKRACLLLLFLIAAAANLFAQDGRQEMLLNDGWKFHRGGLEFAYEPFLKDDAWQQVQLPHTWNADDPFDNDDTYFRGIGWYRRHLHLDAADRNKKIYLVFEGANQETDVFVNGSFAGRHKGGYTGFSIDISPWLQWNKEGESDNSLAVQVNNAHDPFIPPLSVGYALYGGIYRNLWLVKTHAIHFAGVNSDASGIRLHPVIKDAATATINMQAKIVNEMQQDRKLQVVNSVVDSKGKLLFSFSKDINLAAGKTATVNLISESIATPHLWSPEDPYLYSVVSTIQEGDKILDEVRNPLGFRWYRFSADSGFFLNGKKYQLRGTNRHQDRQGKGSALSYEDHRQDMQIIKNMGANFLRLAHYPQAPDVLRLADELGILIWEEVPLVNYMNIDPSFLENSRQMLREMIGQHYNHPSIIMWGSMNEILLYSKEGARIPRHSDTAYLRRLHHYAMQLDRFIRKQDPYRYSTMAMHGSNDYDKFGLDTISMIAGHNIYNGWYSGKVSEFGSWLDRLHAQKPQQIIFISEYGAGSIQSLNTSHPERLDFTGEYQRYYHESYLRQINSRPFLAGTAIWNEFDFSQPNIGGPMSHMNKKGMLTWDRKCKDVYYLYKANWNPAPMVYIAARDWQKRAGKEGQDFAIDVYSNAESVTLLQDGRKIGRAAPDAIHKAGFTVKLHEGANRLEAFGSLKGQMITDHFTLYYQALSPVTAMPADGAPLYINVGSNAQFTGPDGEIWLQDQPYRKGSYGYISGKQARAGLKDRISGTLLTPLYYSLNDSLTAYQLDVPDGSYTLSLYFMEYEKKQAGERVFNVLANGQLLIRHLDLMADYGFCQAVEKTFQVQVSNGQGIRLTFPAAKAGAVLCGIRLVKR